MLSSNQIRSIFLNYFASHGHKILPSASLVPHNDPTLLFTNAGMVPFKNIFTGEETRPCKRATTAQKVVRAGGKHNDLDNVGYTARHHTFFEMMGNFSFGDYFKAEVIDLAWTLLTKEFKLPQEKLLVTIYADDDEAASLWKKIAGLPDSKIIPIATQDNFWRMGDTGPCGPSSEIFYDHGPDVAGGPPGSADEDGDRFVEIWNLVFMQFFEQANGERTNLPRPSIDTGLGLERFAALMQGKKDNFDTDTLRALIEASSALLNQPADGQFKTSHRVVADHLRSTSFLIADGVLPEREGRGYVLRRIMRRAMRHLHMMGAREPVFYKLLPALIEQMGDAYPELIRHKVLIEQTIYDEEKKFTALLVRGMALLEKEIENLSSSSPSLPGDIAFKLYDTYGFPLDLTQDILRERHYKVDEAGFENAMKEQRQRARAAWSGSGDHAVETHWFNIYDRFGATEFTGYQSEKTEAEVQAIFEGSNELAQAKEGMDIAILLNQTPFYGESGGQKGDQGYIVNKDGLSIKITDTRKQAESLYIHYGHVLKGTIKPGMMVVAEIDKERRNNTKAHHTATHLLHAALRKYLGEHVTQKGSLNDSDHLRFDFSLAHPVDKTILQKIEEEINAYIRHNASVSTRIMTKDDAIEQGAMALFGEKYGDDVRVVSIDNDDNEQYSIELCGGTHVSQLSEIGHFKILSETGIASGVRRIEAVCAKAAAQEMHRRDVLLEKIESVLKVSAQNAPEKIEKLLDDNKQFLNKISALQQKLALHTVPKEEAHIHDITLKLYLLNEINPRDLRPLAEKFIHKEEKTIIVLLTETDGKASIIICASQDLKEKINVVPFVKKSAMLMGGQGGGGKPLMAQAGGKKAAVKEIFEALKKDLESI